MTNLSISNLNLTNLTFSSVVKGATFNVAQSQIINETGKSNGYDLDCDDNTLVVGAYSSATAYIYTFNGTSWVKNLTLVKTGRFGYKVAVSGEWAAISNIPANGNGSVYVYRRAADGSWPATEFTRIDVPTNFASFGGFSSDVAIDGTTIVIGHRQYNTVGGAHVYTFDGATWVRNPNPISVAPALTRVETVQNIGISVSIDKNCIVLGGSGDTIGRGKGIAAVSFRQGNVWSIPTILKPDLDSLDGFGWAVRVRGNTIVVGAPYGVNANTVRFTYVYKITGQTITLDTRLAVATNSSQIIQDPLYVNTDNEGWAVDISRDENVVFSSAVTRNNVGIVYVYEKVDGVWTKSAIKDSWLSPIPAPATARFGSAIGVNSRGVVVGAFNANNVYWFK